MLIAYLRQYKSCNLAFFSGEPLALVPQHSLVTCKGVYGHPYFQNQAGMGLVWRGTGTGMLGPV